MEEMEKLFNEKKEAVKASNKIEKDLNQMIIDKWGFHYSDGDFDEIANTLEYGINDMSFKSFCQIMDEATK